MKNKKVTTALYLIAGVLFIVASIIGENYVFIPIGCCFLVLSFTQGERRKEGKD